MYDSKVQNALLAIIRLCQRTEHWRELVLECENPHSAPHKLKKNKFWKVLVDKTNEAEGAWLIIRMLKDIKNNSSDPAITMDEWCSLRGERLDDFVLEFARRNKADYGFSEELIDTLSLGLGPWPSGNGET